MTDYPQWRKDRCEYCKAGIPLGVKAKFAICQTHWSAAERGWYLCTAPDVDEYIAALEAELADMNSVFQLRQAADMRAIKRWQQANPGNDLVWPDQVDLTIWLEEKVAACEAQINDMGRDIIRQAETEIELADLTVQPSLPDSVMLDWLESQGDFVHIWVDEDLAGSLQLLSDKFAGRTLRQAIREAIIAARDAQIREAESA